MNIAAYPELMGDDLRCIACKSKDVNYQGELKALALAQPENRGALFGVPRLLYACRNCKIKFCYPFPDQAKLMDYYKSFTDSDIWVYDTDRPFERYMSEMLEECPDRSILDVGCFRGDFLVGLDEKWRKFGIEPSSQASETARKRGGRVLGNDIESVLSKECKFGIITLIDVIEHLPYPTESLKQLSSMLLPRGKIIILTGATDSWSWRMSGNNYWYSAFPEHLAFFNEPWFRWVAPLIGCSISSVKRLPYTSSKFTVRVKEALVNLIYIVGKRVSGKRRIDHFIRRLPMIARVVDNDICYWTTANDHILVSLKKW